MTQRSDTASPPASTVLGFRDLLLFYVVTSFSLRWVATAAAAGPSALVIWVDRGARAVRAAGVHACSSCRRAIRKKAASTSGASARSDRSPRSSPAGRTGDRTCRTFPACCISRRRTRCSSAAPSWQALSSNSTYFIVVSMAGLALAVAMNVVGLNVGKWLSNVGAIAGWIPALLLIALGVVSWSRFGSATPMTAARVRAEHQPEGRDLLVHDRLRLRRRRERIDDGRGDRGCAADRAARDPGGRRASSRCSTSPARSRVLLAMPKEQVSGLQGIMQAIQAMTAKVGVAWLAPIVAALVTLNALGGVGGWFAATARLPFVAGIDRFLPPAFGELHPTLADAVRRAARAGGDRGAVRVPRPGGHVGARRLRRARQHGHHRVFHPVPVHVRGDDRAAARAGRSGRDARAGRAPVADRRWPSLGFVVTAGVDRAGVRAAGRRAEQDAGGREGRRRVGGARRHRRGVYLLGRSHGSEVDRETNMRFVADRADRCATRRSRSRRRRRCAWTTTTPATRRKNASASIASSSSRCRGRAIRRGRSTTPTAASISSRSSTPRAARCSTRAASARSTANGRRPAKRKTIEPDVLRVAALSRAGQAGPHRRQEARREERVPRIWTRRRRSRRQVRRARRRSADAGPLIKLHESGDPATKLDLLILGDGYTAARARASSSATRGGSSTTLFATSPFKERQRDINVWGLVPPAAQSGISRPSQQHLPPIAARRDLRRVRLRALRADVREQGVSRHRRERAVRRRRDSR